MYLIDVLRFRNSSERVRLDAVDVITVITKQTSNTRFFQLDQLAFFQKEHD